MTVSLPLVDKAASATALHAVAESKYKSWLDKQGSIAKNWLKGTKFQPKPGKSALVPNAKGDLDFVLHITSNTQDIWSIADLSLALPEGTYKLEGSLSKELATDYALGWALGSYVFDRYKTGEKQKPSKLVMPKGADKKKILNLAETIFTTRDLINTPAGEMLPSHFSKAAIDIAKKCKAKHVMISGKELEKEYPTTYTVGKSSFDGPRLVDIRWGKQNAPKVTLVGKGVCFDSGGINIKSAGNMKLMKKDMAGAAIVLGLGRAIINAGINVNLRILLPMVENAVSDKAMHPLDVIKTRKGITVEVGHTDAEGRLTICDALAEADSEKPDLLIDCTTLTGAARVALGTDCPAFFTDDDKLAAQLEKAAKKTNDPVYRMPLNREYRSLIDGSTADISNDAEGSYAGAITAALFLKEFVDKTPSWLHFDMMAWNLSSRPGRPKGAEAQALRAMFALIEDRYG